LCRRARLLSGVGHNRALVVATMLTGSGRSVYMVMLAVRIALHQVDAVG